MVEFLEIAALELHEAIEYYETISEGLGVQFLSEVERSADQIALFPRAGTLIVHSQVPAGTRQLVLKTFPYSIVYSEPELIIVALAHQKRRPHFWLRRLGQGPP